VSSYVSVDAGVLRVAEEVAGWIGVLVRRKILVEVVVVLGRVRMISVGTELVEPGAPGVGVASTGSSTGGSVGTGTVSDSSIKGVVIAGSVPK
jgi:hypothetical protein